MPYALLVATLSFAVTLLAGRPIIRALSRRGMGERINFDGPASHESKSGTPTMGGLIILLPVLLITALFNLVGHRSILLPLGTIVGCGILGAVDDLLPVLGGRRSGLTARLKMLWLLAIAGGAAVVLYYFLQARSVNIPFVGKQELGLWYLPVAVFTVVGAANAVNITDGLDTLAGGTVAIAFAAYGVVAFLQQQSFLLVFSYTVVGAILGFLWYNAHPAQVFMGDTGSLALGGTLGVVALMTGHWLLLPIIGFVFVAETASVILQVAYFKASGGKRLFRMAPLHHHFELSGWKETQVTMRFWLVGILAAMVGIALALS